MGIGQLWLRVATSYYGNHNLPRDSSHEMADESCRTRRRHLHSCHSYHCLGIGNPGYGFLDPCSKHCPWKTYLERHPNGTHTQRCHSCSPTADIPPLPQFPPNHHHTQVPGRLRCLQHRRFHKPNNCPRSRHGAPRGMLGILLWMFGSMVWLLGSMLWLLGLEL